ncbi:MAG TPA: ankyrin repeat domain-containing protein, partial [Chlamydiales bacterium]
MIPPVTTSIATPPAAAAPQALNSTDKIVASVGAAAIAQVAQTGSVFSSDEKAVPSAVSETAQPSQAAQSASQRANARGRNVLHNAVMQKMEGTALSALIDKHPGCLEQPDEQGNTPLLLAASIGSYLVCRALINKKANLKAINDNQSSALHLAISNEDKTVAPLIFVMSKSLAGTQDAVGNTPLHLAVLKRKEDCVVLFAKEKKLIEEKNNDGNTPLLVAIKAICVLEKDSSHGYEDEKIIYQKIIEILIKARASLRTADKGQSNALHMAIIGKNVKLVQRFIEEDSGLLEIPDEKGNTPLLLAAACGQKEIYKILLKAGANEKVENKEGRNSLFLSVIANETKMVEWLAKKEWLLNSTDKSKNNALHIAASWDRLDNCLDICQILIKAGIDQRALNLSLQSALHVAVAAGKAEVVKWFAKRKLLLESKGNFGNTPLIDAAGTGNLKNLEALLQEGANLDARDNKGWTALHVAVCYNKTEIIRFLLAQNKDLLKAQDNMGNTPFFCAALFGRRDICEIFLEKESAIKFVVNKSKQNPLHAASVNNHEEIIKCLSSNETLLHAVDAEGNTPLFLAAIVGHLPACEILIKAGAKTNVLD